MLLLKNVMKKIMQSKKIKEDSGVGYHFSWNSQELPL